MVSWNIKTEKNLRSVLATEHAKLGLVKNCLNSILRWLTNVAILLFTWTFEGWETRWDKSLRHVAATGCCNKSPRVTCENHCRCDRILSLRSVAQIQTGLNLCDISQRQTKRKRLVAAAVQTRRRVAAICRIVCLGLETWYFCFSHEAKGILHDPFVFWYLNGNVPWK